MDLIFLTWNIKGIHHHIVKILGFKNQSLCDQVETGELIFLDCDEYAYKIWKNLQSIVQETKSNPVASSSKLNTRKHQRQRKGQYNITFMFDNPAFYKILTN